MGDSSTSYHGSSSSPIDIVNLICDSKYVHKQNKIVDKLPQNDNINVHLVATPPTGDAVWENKTRPHSPLWNSEDISDSHFTNLGSNTRPCYAPNYQIHSNSFGVTEPNLNYGPHSSAFKISKRPILPIKTPSFANPHFGCNFQQIVPEESDIVSQAVYYGLVQAEDDSHAIFSCLDLIRNAIGCIYELNFFKNTMISGVYCPKLKMRYDSMNFNLNYLRNAINDRLLNFKPNSGGNCGDWNHRRQETNIPPLQNMHLHNFGANNVFHSSMVNHNTMAGNNWCPNSYSNSYKRINHDDAREFNSMDELSYLKYT